MQTTMIEMVTDNNSASVNLPHTPRDILPVTKDGISHIIIAIKFVLLTVYDTMESGSNGPCSIHVHDISLNKFYRYLSS